MAETAAVQKHMQISLFSGKYQSAMGNNNNFRCIRKSIGKPVPRLRCIVLGLSLCECIAMADHDIAATPPSLQPTQYEY